MEKLLIDKEEHTKKLYTQKLSKYTQLLTQQNKLVSEARSSAKSVAEVMKTQEVTKVLEGLQHELTTLKSLEQTREDRLYQEKKSLMALVEVLKKAIIEIETQHKNEE